jgi:bifunctional glutamyl/prolyl-tRNA synthetase
VEIKPDTKSSAGGRTLGDIDSDIVGQGNKIRDLKAQKASKEPIDTEVKKLLSLKQEFKAAAGKDWDPKGCSKIV